MAFGMDAGNPAALQLGVEIQQDRSWLDEFRADVKAAKESLRSLAEQQSKFNERQTAMARAQEAAMKRAYAAGEQFRKSMRQSFDHAATAARNAVNWTARWGTVAGAAAAGGVTLLIRKGIQLNSQMQQFRLTLETVYRSRAQANDMLKWVERFAEKTPFNVESLVDASVQLESVGLNAKRYLPTIGNLASAFGGTRAEVDQLIRSLTLLNSGAPGMAMRALFKFGISYDDFRRQGISVNSRNQLGGTGEERLQAFENIVNSRFPGLMAKQSKTFQGVMSNIEDIYHRALRQTTEPLFESITQKVHQLYEWLRRLSDDGTLAEWSRKIGGNLKGAFSSLAGIAEGGFAAGREGGIGEGLNYVWDRVKGPAGEFTAWFADKLAAGVEFGIRAGLKAVPSAASIAADNPALAALLGMYLAPNVMKAGGALAKGAWHAGSAAAGAADFALYGAGAGGIGSLAGILGIPALTMLVGAAGRYAIENVYADGTTGTLAGNLLNPNKAMGLGRGIFGQMNDSRVMSIHMADRNPLADMMWSKREAVWNALPELMKQAQEAAGALKGFSDSIRQFVAGASARKDAFAANITDIGDGLWRGLGGGPAFELEQIRARGAALWEQGNPLFDETLGRINNAAASRVGVNPAELGNVVANAETSLNQQRDAYEEILRLKTQELQLEQKLSAETAKTNQALLDRVAELKPRDRARYFANVEKALGFQGLDPNDAARQLAGLGTKELNDIAGTGVLDPGLVATARRQQLAGLARQQGRFGAAGYLEGLAVTPRDPREAMAEFQRVAEDVRDKFNVSVDDLTAAMEKLDNRLSDTISKMVNDILDAAGKRLNVDVNFPNALDVKMATQIFDEAKFKEWIATAVRQAFPDANGVENHGADGVVGATP